jgi:hypothetical protein
MNYPELSTEEKQRRRERLLAGRATITPEQFADSRAKGHQVRAQQILSGQYIHTSEGSLQGGLSCLEQGVGIHDPENIDLVTEGGRRGRHTRWHVNRKRFNLRCGYCRERLRIIQEPNV